MIKKYNVSNKMGDLTKMIKVYDLMFFLKEKEKNIRTQIVNNAKSNFYKRRNARIQDEIYFIEDLTKEIMEG